MYDSTAAIWELACGSFPQYVINMSHLLEYEQAGLSTGTVLSLVASLSSLCFGPIHTMVKDDIKAVVAKHKRPADGEAGQGGGSPHLLSRRQVSWWLLALGLAAGLPCAAALWGHGAVRSLDDRHGVALLAGIVLSGLLGVLGAGAALAAKNYCPTRQELDDARETLAAYLRWAARRLVVLGPVVLIEVVHFFPILIEHYVYGGLGSRGYVRYLVAFNAPKLLFLLMKEMALDGEWKDLCKRLTPIGLCEEGGDADGNLHGFMSHIKTYGADWKVLYLLLTPLLALVLPCGALLLGARGAGLVAGVVIGGLWGAYLGWLFLIKEKDESFVRQHPGWAPVLLVMPLVPCVLAIEAGFKGNGGRQNGAKWNAHLLLIYMLTAYGSMGLMLRGGGAGHWTRVSLAASYALLALIAATWLYFHEMMTALTAEGGGVLDKLDASGGSWQARLHRALVGGHAELDLSNCGMGATAARAVADDLPKL
jgi:hypothetical protein